MHRLNKMNLHKKIFFAALSVVLLAEVIANTALAQKSQNDARYIDTHSHLSGSYRSQGRWTNDYEAAARNALAIMDRLAIQKSLIMPPPFPAEHLKMYDYTALAEVARKYPDRFGFLGGGGTLNTMIQEAVAAGKVMQKLKQQFKDKALEIVRAGAAGFGEMTTEHFSFNQSHPYVSAPPDFPLFLLLADIAAENKMPIDLHMEAIPQEMPLPSGFKSPPNPKTLKANIPALERLLSHNRKAAIVWVHVGWDNTGEMSVTLLRRLLKAHSNLYMSLKVLGQAGRQNQQTRPVDAGGKIRPEWLEMIREFPDRFLMGGDEFYGIPGRTRRLPESSEATLRLVEQLPEELARKTGWENALRIYRLK